MDSDPEYRVVWVSTWDTVPKRRRSAPIATLTEAETHRDYVADTPHVRDVRIQVRTWQDVT